MASIKVAYRSIIMLGTLSVGALGYRAYAPQVDPVVTRLRDLAIDLLDRGGPSSVDPRSSPELPALPPVVDPSGPIASISGPAPLVDSHVQPISSDIVIDQTPVGLGPESTHQAKSAVALVVAELQQRGVNEYSLVPWGSAGQFYRFQCSAAWGVDGRFARQFESIDADPAAAADQVLQQVAMWQDASTQAVGNGP